MHSGFVLSETKRAKQSKSNFELFIVVSLSPSCGFEDSVGTFPALCLVLHRTQHADLCLGHSQRGGYRGSLCSDLVFAPEVQFWLLHVHCVWVPPSVPSPGSRPVLPGGGWGDRQRVIGDLSFFSLIGNARPFSPAALCNNELTFVSVINNLINNVSDVKLSNLIGEKMMPNYSH